MIMILNKLRGKTKFCTYLLDFWPEKDPLLFTNSVYNNALK